MKRHLSSLARSGVIAFGALAGVCMPAMAGPFYEPSFNFPSTGNVNDETCANALDCASGQSGFQSAVLIRPAEQSDLQSVAFIPHGGGFHGGFHGGGGWHGGGWHGGGWRGGWRGGGWHGGWHGGGWHRGWHRGWHGGWGGGWGWWGVPFLPFYGGLFDDFYDYGPDYYTPYYYAPRPRYRVHLTRAHIRWCESHYRSYRVFDNTFQPLHGPRRQCISPFG